MAGKGSTTSSSSHLLVAAFDFGTTYSGYAFSFRDDPMKIQTNQGWNAGSEKLISLKTPTCVLLRPNKQFDSFGFEAENKYADLAEDNKHHGWMLFKRFKMLLHNNDGLNRASTVEDINGKSMPAMQIFSMAIGFLRDHLLKALNAQTVGVNENDLQYVITVPAIWNDNAKQFMREAATEAGLDSSRLKLSLEPEAASIWCQTVTTDLKKSLSDVGCQYMVVDLGGGTADISVHEKKADGSLKEIHKASGGPWGGTAVDKNYFDWLTNLFGQRTMERFKREQMADYFDVQREFELKKRNIMTDTTGKITFRLSASLREIYEEAEGANLKRKVADMSLNDKVTFTSDKLRLDVSIVRGWFRVPINEIIVHMKNLLAEEKMKNVKKILLVGGFGECQLVQENLRSQLQNKTVIVPNEAGLAVLKGAVRFGHLPNIVSSRVMKYTYGVAVVVVNDSDSQSGSDAENKSSDDDEHCDDSDSDGYDQHNSLTYQEDNNSVVHIFGDNDQYSYHGELVDDNKSSSEEESNDDKSVVDDVFDKFVETGEEIPVGHEVKRVYTPMNPDCVEIPVYCSSDPDPELVTDPGCKKLGVLSIDFPDGVTCEDNENEVTLIFGDTELIVKAKILRTGLEFFTIIDCLK
ncbi:heat shock 70 kDa protein 12A-like [Mercenaria mercenaria]|uniref:heat shock 70 kDa protein 12A-like n=1 Tax=Mercenaria mercenaria TaxID=6596 RepID=UPI001E1D537F|nr:heat shock 70 kDa protein 12A-like [Mercenaria mercenaria]XP_045176741.1 heat shock 70 kDa protein 12A-like [Mercenaria mercenaria]XP_045176742.1 heat shock 70 kDa protein 12A-like [Mercenaria mercenaria]XP_045176743.1 heat shock 70 kDa protein 12A-like [Mercenaria mercenaria]